MSFMPIQDTPVIRILEQAATQLTPTGPFSDWPSLSVSLVGSPCPGSLFSSKGIRKTIHPRAVRSGREFLTAPLGCRTKYGPCAPNVHCPPFSLWSLAVVDSGPTSLSLTLLVSSQSGAPDVTCLPEHSTRARTRRTTVGGGESSEGGRYRIWLLLGLVARHTAR